MMPIFLVRESNEEHRSGDLEWGYILFLFYEGRELGQ